MKNIWLLFIIISLLFAKTALAEPEAANQKLEGTQATQASAVNIEKIIDNYNIQEFITTRAVDGVDILPQNDPKDNRTCSFCWLFALIFGCYLFNYGEKLKKRKRLPKDWYHEPIYYGMFTYITHALFHQYFASTIFLNYYWMIIFDELIIAFVYYQYLIGISKVNRRLTRKMAN